MVRHDYPLKSRTSFRIGGVAEHFVEPRCEGELRDALARASDREWPVRALGGRTPLQAAETPTLDRLAKEGQCGLADPVAPGVVPDTAAGSLALFGQSPLALKRGPTEALGAAMTLHPGDVALRGNFATLGDDGHVIDRRAGRIRKDAEVLAKHTDMKLVLEEVAHVQEGPERNVFVGAGTTQCAIHRAGASGYAWWRRSCHRSVHHRQR